MTVGFMSKLNFKGALPQFGSVSSQMPVGQSQQGPVLSPQQPPTDVFTPSSSNTNTQSAPETATPNAQGTEQAPAPEAQVAGQTPQPEGAANQPPAEAPKQA